MPPSTFGKKGVPSSAQTIARLPPHSVPSASKPLLPRVAKPSASTRAVGGVDEGLERGGVDVLELLGAEARDQAGPGPGDRLRLRQHREVKGGEVGQPDPVLAGCGQPPKSSWCR